MRRVMGIGSTLIITIGILWSCSNSSSGGGIQAGTNSPVTNETLAATNVTQPVLRKTLPASWDENWFASPSVFDIDRDGKPEIIAGRHSVLYVWNSSGTLLWRAPVGESASSTNNHGSSRQYASPVVGDLDDDGYGEIAIAYSNKVALYDRSGSIRAGWPKEFPGSQDEIRSIAAIDLDRDGHKEILAQKTGSGPVTIVWKLNGETAPGWPQVQGCDQCNEYGGYNQNIGAADLTGDGVPEVVSTYDCCHIGIMRGDGSPLPANPMYQGPFVSSVPMFHAIELAKQGWGADGNDRDEFTDSPPVFGDIDNDGLPEIILYSDHEQAGPRSWSRPMTASCGAFRRMAHWCGHTASIPPGTHSSAHQGQPSATWTMTPHPRSSLPRIPRHRTCLTSSYSTPAAQLCTKYPFTDGAA